MSKTAETELTFEQNLLRLAAKAAGYTVMGFTSEGGLAVLADETYWSPLRREGDALRLAILLRMHVNVYATRTTVTADGIFFGANACRGPVPGHSVGHHFGGCAYG